MCSATHRHPAAARRPGPSGAHACVRGTAAAHGPRGPTRPHGLIGAAARPRQLTARATRPPPVCGWRGVGRRHRPRASAWRRPLSRPPVLDRICPGPQRPAHSVLVPRNACPPTPHPYFQAGEGGGSAPDEGVDLGGLNLVHAAHGLRDLSLVRARVDDEDEGVVVCARLGGAVSCTALSMELPAGAAPHARVQSAGNERRSAATTRAAASAGRQGAAAVAGGGQSASHPRSSSWQTQSSTGTSGSGTGPAC